LTPSLWWAQGRAETRNDHDDVTSGKEGGQHGGLDKGKKEIGGWNKKRHEGGEAGAALACAATTSTATTDTVGTTEKGNRAHNHAPLSFLTPTLSCPPMPFWPRRPTTANTMRRTGSRSTCWNWTGSKRRGSKPRAIRFISHILALSARRILCMWACPRSGKGEGRGGGGGL
jgi:hypothetical protein